jgi:hypothetical protein
LLLVIKGILYLLYFLSWNRQFTTGDYFGEAALIQSEKEVRRMANVEALSELVVLSL